MRSRTIKEGSLGLFIFGGLSLLGVVLIWLTGATFSRKTYIINVTFADANGLREGAVTRYRGLEIGRVVSVNPNSNGVNVQIEVNSADLVMPKNSIIETNQAGLVGEPDIEIIPKAVLSEAAIAQSPLANDCGDSGDIICHDDQLEGVIGVSFEETLRLTQQFSRAYSDEEFVALISKFAENSSSAAEQLAALTAELTLLSKDVRGEVGNFSENAQSITDAAINSSAQLSQTMTGINELTTNLNSLVVENRQTLVSTLNSISETGVQMQQAIATLDTTLQTVNNGLAAADTRQLAENLTILTENAAIASENLKDISVTFNDPENITILQKTLDAARSTFENTQKITSDLDELTGDPEFRKNLIDLVNGLSQLVSSTDQLQEQIQIANRLEPAQAELELSTPNLSARSESPETSVEEQYQ
ncbi:Mammalian cell entry related domain protein [[Leptolyngbya] sp. PCC 7376]|uniref:MlaD family protein n=1 Tax=[Leptolyngbya] sp. PCC 7376 TaxID=111781 RepID=UPI00029F2DCB|nr:MlaD family protein [[Leptolyngbya] sp. PCC 7376]AFY37144.1 Mammalian cell entry related domain protein [[Leptolyngbya] sp. PCC 7376]